MIVMHYSVWCTLYIVHDKHKGITLCTFQRGIPCEKKICVQSVSRIIHNCNKSFNVVESICFIFKFVNVRLEFIKISMKMEKELKTARWRERRIEII